MVDEPQLALDLTRTSPRGRQTLAPGAVLLPGLALPVVDGLMVGVATITGGAPLRHMKTPGGRSMSVGTTNAGPLGWVSDGSGYRYVERDPDSGAIWPALPAAFFELASRAAREAGYAHFEPDACLINYYVPGARMGMHQDKDERDFTQPIVSVSLGLPALFMFGGETRKERPACHVLEHGDVVVFGGPARRCYHGIKPVKPGSHPLLGAQRINLTFRRAR